MTTQTEITKKPLSGMLKTFWGIGDLGFQLMVSVGMYYLAFFLTDVAKLPLGVAALCSTLPSIFDFALSPTYGAVIELVKPMRWGKFRSWLILTIPLLLFLHPLQYTLIGNTAVASVIIVACACLSRPCQNIPWNANYAIVAEIAAGPEDIVMLNSRRVFWTGISSFIWSTCNVAVIGFFSGLFNSEIAGYTGLQFVCALAMVLGYFAHFKMTQGYEKLPSEEAAAETSAVKKEKTKLSDLLRNLGQNPQLLAFLIGDYGTQAAGFIATGTIAYMFTYVIQDFPMMTICLTATSIATLVGSFIAPLLGRKLSSRSLILLACFGSAALTFSKFFLWGNAWLYIAGNVIAAVPIAFINIAKQSIYADLAVLGEYRTHKDVKGFVIGMQTVPLKLGSLSRGAIIAFALAAINYVAGADPTPELQQGITTLAVIVPSAGYAFTGLVAALFVKLPASKVQEMKAEIAARKAAGTE